MGVWGGEPLSESVWAAGRSVTAGDLEMLLQSPTKEENRDNTALIPAGRQPPSDGGRGVRAGPGWAAPGQAARARKATAPPDAVVQEQLCVGVCKLKLNKCLDQ